ncbi:uncharacterized protein [Antedon mediterranea]|uniref:uncharacterized protein n=1 Tax=Antedon mediterranea TaxID=105859 RepID=UPI003AF9C68B
MVKVIGQEGVGKTSLVNACLGNKFNEKHEITDGVSVIKTVETNAKELTKWTEDEESDDPTSLFRKHAEENIKRIIEVQKEVVVEERKVESSLKNVRIYYINI